MCIICGGQESVSVCKHFKYQFVISVWWNISPGTFGPIWCRLAVIRAEIWGGEWERRTNIILSYLCNVVGQSTIWEGTSILPKGWNFLFGSLHSSLLDFFSPGTIEPRKPYWPNSRDDESQVIQTKLEQLWWENESSLCGRGGKLQMWQNSTNKQIYVRDFYRSKHF